MKLFFFFQGKERKVKKEKATDLGEVSSKVGTLQLYYSKMIAVGICAWVSFLFFFVSNRTQSTN